MDALRGIAAGGVLIYHYGAHFQRRPLYDLLMPLYTSGFYLVDFFFVLSGFVLTKAYFRAPRRHDRAENILRRVARIYPLHLLTFGSVALGQYWMQNRLQQPPFIYPFNDLYHGFLNLGLAQFVGLQRGFSFNGPSWSISTEFYVNILFLLMISFARPPRRSFAFLVAVCAALLVMMGGRIIMYFTYSDLIRTAMGFFCGVVLHQLVGGQNARNSGLWDAVFVAIAAVLALAATGTAVRVPFFDFLVVIAAYPILMVAAMRGIWVRAMLRMRPLVYIGRISYAIYMVHFPLQLLLQIVVIRHPGAITFDSATTLMGYTLLVLCTSSLVYHTVEIPAQRMINSLWQKHSPTDTV